MFVINYLTAPEKGTRNAAGIRIPGNKYKSILPNPTTAPRCSGASSSYEGNRLDIGQPILFYGGAGCRGLVWTQDSRCAKKCTVIAEAWLS